MSLTELRRRGALAAMLLVLAAASPRAADAPIGSLIEDSPKIYATRSRVDWKARSIIIDIELDLVAAGLRLPEGRLAAQSMIERDIPALAKNAVLGIQADSHRTVEDAVTDGTFDPAALVALAGLARLDRSSFSKDLRKFLATYSLRLDAVSSLFLSGAPPPPIRVPLETRPTRAYSGIVIYARGSLPVHGESMAGKAEPCLFPRVYDSEMSLVLDRSVVLPEALRDAGVLGYASAVGVDAGERVGSDPMRVMALELFGDARTDYVIAREDALRILSSPNNRELLRRGKVVVVIGD